MSLSSRLDVSEEQTRCADLAQTMRSMLFPSSQCSCVCWGRETYEGGGRDEGGRREGGGYGNIKNST